MKANKLNLNVQKTKLLVPSRKRREQETMEVQVKIDGKRLERSRVVKYLGVLLDDKLQWNEQVKEVKRKACAGLASLRHLQHVLPTTIKMSIYNSLLFNCTVRVFKEVAPGVGEDPELRYAYCTFKASQTPSERHRQVLGWKTLEKRREHMRMAMVHKFMTGRAPITISECLKTNAQIGNTRTRGKFNLILK